MSQRFEDAFERAELGRDYWARSPAWALSDGRLCGENAQNRPIWLRRRLPPAVRVEFDAVSHSSEGDIKVELFGDGKSAASSTSYDDASGYVFIYGGWQNRLHVLARLDEHGDDRLALHTRPGGQNPRSAPVTPGQTYRFAIERRDGKTVRWFVDGVQVHALSDPDPLLGPKHEYFGFNAWRARVCFDNLQVVPLGN